jgi:hypothetical protein
LPQARLRNQTGKWGPVFSYVPLAILSPVPFRCSKCSIRPVIAPLNAIGAEIATICPFGNTTRAAHLLQL